MNRGFCFRLDPSAAQARQMMSSAGVCRLIYNLALEQRRAFHRQFRQSTGRSISYVTQARELTDLRASYDWIRAVSQTAQQQALRDLEAPLTSPAQRSGRRPVSTGRSSRSGGASSRRS